MTLPALIFGLGLCVGFLVGVATDDALDLYRSARKERPPVNRPAWITRTRVLTAIFGAIVLVQFATGVLLISTYTKASSYTTCSARWQDEMSVAFRARAAVAAEASTALDRIIRAVAEDNDRAFRRALESYVKVRDRQDRQRQKNPLPEPPEALCGEPGQ